MVQGVDTVEVTPPSELDLRQTGIHLAENSLSINTARFMWVLISSNQQEKTQIGVYTAQRMGFSAFPRIALSFFGLIAQNMRKFTDENGNCVSRKDYNTIQPRGRYFSKSFKSVFYFTTYYS